MRRADNIEAEFPPGVTMPAELRQLCDYLDDTGYPISGLMKLRPEGNALKHWFGDGTDAWCQLAGFGADSTGSPLALWLYAGPDTSKAPVVSLGSEGDKTVVLANNIRDFLMLFGIGYDDLGAANLNQPPTNPDSAADLRDWLAAKFGIHCPETGIAVAEHGRSRHPDFAQWVEDAVESTITRDEPEAEALRQRVFAVAEDMIRDGRSQVYQVSSAWWSMDFKVVRYRNQLLLDYRDRGKWHPMPEQYEIDEVVARLLQFVRNKERDHYEVSVVCSGHVTVGPYRELVLVPPANDAN